MKIAEKAIEPKDFEPSKKMPAKEMRRNILILTPSEKSIVTTSLVNFPGAMIFHQNSEETDINLPENIFHCDITANNATFEFYSKMDKTWSFQYENYCHDRSKLSFEVCHQSTHFKALCPYFPIKVFKLNQRLSVAKELLDKIPDLKIILDFSDPRMSHSCENKQLADLCKKRCDDLNEDYNEALALGKKFPGSVTVIREFDFLLQLVESTWALSEFLNLPLLEAPVNFQVPKNSGVNPPSDNSEKRMKREASPEKDEYKDYEEAMASSAKPLDYHKLVMSIKEDITWAEKLCTDFLANLGLVKFNGPRNISLPEMLAKSPIEVWPF